MISSSIKKYISEKIGNRKTYDGMKFIWRILMCSKLIWNQNSFIFTSIIFVPKWFIFHTCSFIQKSISKFYWVSSSIWIFHFERNKKFIRYHFWWLFLSSDADFLSELIINLWFEKLFLEFKSWKSNLIFHFTLN